MIRVLDEVVDDPVLQSVHNERENEHDKRDLYGFAAFGPAEGPVTHPGDPGEEGKDGKNAEFHADQAEEIDDGLLEPPCSARWVTVVPAADGLGRIGEWGERESTVEDFQEQDKDWDADCSLYSLVQVIVG